jgi:hypothetical protein
MMLHDDRRHDNASSHPWLTVHPAVAAVLIADLSSSGVWSRLQ